MKKCQKFAPPFNAEELLHELQAEAKKTETEDIKVEVLFPNTGISPARRRRQSLMDNRRNRYVYSADDSVLHDRDCPKVNTISDENFHMSPDIIDGMTMCSDCYQRMWIRSAVSGSGKQLNAYDGIFRRMGATNPDIKKLFRRNHAQLISVRKDEVALRVKDDEWIILFQNGIFRLLHNNYRINKDYSRDFSGGFHPHKLPLHSNLRSVIDQICAYSWQEHIDRMKRQQHQKAVEKVSMLMEKTVLWRYENRLSLIYTEVTFLDCNGRGKKFLRKDGVRFDQVRSIPKTDSKKQASFSKTTLRIRSKDLDKFIRSMWKLRSYVIHSELVRYPYLLKLHIDQSRVVKKRFTEILKERVTHFFTKGEPYDDQ